MSNYNFVEELIKDGLDMLATSFIYGEFAKEVPPANMTVAQEKRYRYSLFTNAQSYQMWVNNVMSIGLDESDALEVFGAVKAASYRLLANYRAGKFQQTTVSNNEVVVDRVAELEKALKAKTLECNNLKDRLVETETSLNNQINLNQHLATSLRQLSLNKLVTKVAKVVTQKVGF